MGFNLHLEKMILLSTWIIVVTPITCPLNTAGCVYQSSFLIEFPAGPRLSKAIFIIRMLLGQEKEIDVTSVASADLQVMVAGGALCCDLKPYLSLLKMCSLSNGSHVLILMELVVSVLCPSVAWQSQYERANFYYPWAVWSTCILMYDFVFLSYVSSFISTSSQEKWQSVPSPCWRYS